jgi:hypothetical protein
VNWPQRFAVLLRHWEPSALIGRVGRLIYSGVDFLLDNIADLLVDSSENVDVLLDPRYVRKDRELDRRKELFFEPPSLRVVLGERVVVQTHEVVE